MSECVTPRPAYQYLQGCFKRGSLEMSSPFGVIVHRFLLMAFASFGIHRVFQACLRIFSIRILCVREKGSYDISIGAVDILFH